MSALAEKAERPYPEDMIFAHELPDAAPAEHPTPWDCIEAGNGHFYVLDGNRVKVAHVYCYEGSEIETLEQKLSSINGGPISLR